MNVTHVVPVLLRKVYTGRAPLDAGTVHEDMDFAHTRDSLVKDALDGLEVAQVAVQDFHLRSPSLDGVVGGEVDAVSLDEANGSTRF